MYESSHGLKIHFQTYRMIGRLALSLYVTHITALD